MTTNSKNIDITDSQWKSWLTGFIDAEGCFSVCFNKRDRLTFGVEVRPSFSVAQSNKRISIQKRIEILETIKEYFGCGGIRVDRATGMAIYESRNLDDIVTKILPHFDAYPLLTVKDEDFESLKQVTTLMKANQHLNKQGLQKVIDIAFKMNLSGKRKNIKESLLEIIQKKSINKV